MAGEWRDSTFAEYARMPLELCTPLDEERMLKSRQDGGVALDVADLAYLMVLLVPFGGLRDIDLKVGERIIIAPATGPFGGAAVLVALAMGASVVAMGRNLEALERLKNLDKERVEIVQMTGDMEKDLNALKRCGPANAYLDISPNQAANSTHIKSCILALKPGGRVSLMGGIYADVAILHSHVMHYQLTLKGKWMSQPDDARVLLQMVEGGMLKLGEKGGIKIKGRYALRDWKEAFDTAASCDRAGELTVFTP